MRDRVDGVTEVVNVADGRCVSRTARPPAELFDGGASPVTARRWPACCR